MTIEFSCPSCQAQYRVNDSKAGASVSCKQCGHAIEVPAAAGPALDPATDPATCPVCTKPLTPGAEICFACGYEIAPQDASPDRPAASHALLPDSTDDEEERDPDEPLRFKAKESAGVRVGAQVARWTMIVGSVLVMGAIGWWALGAFNTSQAHGEIDTLVTSLIEGKAAAPEAAKDLATQLPYLPGYLASLSARLDKDKAKNPDFSGFEYSEIGNVWQCQVAVGSRVLTVDSEFAKEIKPRSLKEAAAISTLIVNLPSDCDLTPIQNAEDTVGKAAVAKRAAIKSNQD